MFQRPVAPMTLRHSSAPQLRHNLRAPAIRASDRHASHSEANGAREVPARLAAHFAKLWSAVAIELPLWEGGGRELSRGRGASKAARRHDSPSLPKRWPCHRAPKCFARNQRPPV